MLQSTSLEEVTLSKKMNKIGQYAFFSCKALKEVILPEGITEIAESTFYDCKK